MRAVWSDGQPVTADDVVYTALRLCSPAIANTAMMYYVFEGVGDDGFVEMGADHIEGITKVDDKTVRFCHKGAHVLSYLSEFLCPVSDASSKACDRRDP